MAYIQRKSVLNLIGKLEDKLVKKIEELETNTDKELQHQKQIENTTVDLDTAIYYNKPWTYFVLLTVLKCYGRDYSHTAYLRCVSQ